MCSGICTYIFVFFLAIWLSLKFKVAPVIVQRGWFAFWLVVSILATGGLSFLADSLRKVGVSFKVTSTICAWICGWTFWLVAGPLQPHIQIHVDESKQQWSKIPNKSMTAMNHTSFFDAFLFVGNGPFAYIHNCKTMMKSTLRNIPIFGGVFNRVGHFPVYFKSDEDGNFGLDKERQAPVMEKVNAHLDKVNGRLAFFPEGAVNKKPTEGLASFRRGSFNIILEKKLPLYYMCMVGNYDTWPSAAAVGGFGTVIECSVNKFDIDYAKDDAASVAERLQKVMQVECDRLEKLRKSKM